MSERKPSRADDSAHRVMLDVAATLDNAIADLDRVAAPADIAAHVQQAVERLREITLGKH